MNFLSLFVFWVFLRMEAFDYQSLHDCHHKQVEQMFGQFKANLSNLTESPHLALFLHTLL